MEDATSSTSAKPFTILRLSNGRLRQRTELTDDCVRAGHARSPCREIRAPLTHMVDCHAKLVIRGLLIHNMYIASDHPAMHAFPLFVFKCP